MSDPRIDGYRAAWAADEAARCVVLNFRRTCRLLVAGGLARPADRRRLLDLLDAYRTGVLGLADTLAALRAQCGGDAAGCPATDDAVRDELARIVAARDAAERRQFVKGGAA